MKKIGLFLLMSMLVTVTSIPGEGAELRAAFVGIGVPLHFDPALVEITIDFNIALQLFEGLTTLHPQEGTPAFDPGDESPLPGVAKRWTLSEDERVYTFYLRENAVWWDGTPVTAETFKSSWLRVLDPATNAGYTSLLFYIRHAQAYHEGICQADEVGGIGGEFNIFLPQKLMIELIMLSPPIPIEFTILEGKHIDEDFYAGRIIKLCETKAEIEAERVCRPLTNLKVSVFDQQHTCITENVYAKITNVCSHTPPTFRVSFTSMPPEARSFFKQALSG